ncbi:hypothetical protein JXA59_01530 [Patescibacteria group bacterium]|nr:hypothetical protein [Patescibacteria group bacterium]
MKVTDPQPNNEEYLIYRRHPVNLWGPAGLTIVVFLMLIIFWILISSADILPMPESLPYIVLYFGVLLSLAVNYFFMYWAFWYLDIWVVNGEKLIDSQLITFFLHRRSELALRQVQDIRYTIPGTLATIFRFGNILVQSAAKEGSFKLLSIKNPGVAVTKIGALVEAASRVKFQSSSSTMPTVPLGEKLVQEGLISPADLASALSEQAATGRRVGDILVERGLIKRTDLVTALSSQHRIPEIDISRYEIDKTAIKHISYEIAKKYTVIPVSHTNNGVLVAIAVPSELAMNEIRGMVNISVDFVVADEDYIKEAIRGHYLTTDEGPYYSG